MNRVLNLADFRRENIRVYSGRERGSAVRAKDGLDKFDREEGSMTIIIPEDTISFNSSFFLGLLGPSVRALGAGFDKKYSFMAAEIHTADIEEGKVRARLESNVLTAVA